MRLKHLKSKDVTAAKWLRNAALIVGMSLLLLGCQSRPLEVSYKIENVDFTKYQTVKVETLNDGKNNVINMVSNAIKSELTSKGYALGDDPDLVVVYQVLLDRGQRVEQEQIAVMGQLYTRPKLEAVNQATLLVNAYDPALDQVIWKASTVREVTNVNPKNIDQERVNQRVNEIFNSFPGK